MKKTLASLWLFLACAVAWAVPTVEQVQAEVQQGRYAQAGDMMREVVEARPGSAKAHYIYAEILAHEGSFSKAAEEARLARQLDPDIRFTQPEKFQAFERLLEREQRSAQRAETSNPSFPLSASPSPARAQATGIPGWVWLVALGGVGFLLWRGFARSRAAASPSGGYGVPVTAPNNGFGNAPSGGFAGAAGPYPNAPPIPKVTETSIPRELLTSQSLGSSPQSNTSIFSGFGWLQIVVVTAAGVIAVVFVVAVFLRRRRPHKCRTKKT